MYGEGVNSPLYTRTAEVLTFSGALLITVALLLLVSRSFQKRGRKRIGKGVALGSVAVVLVYVCVVMGS